MPEVRADYAGYVAWRGLVDEPELTDEAAALLRDRFSFFEYANSHMLAYLVPGEHEAIEPGKRRYNWVWYRNATENRLAELLIDAEGRQRGSSIPPGLLSAASGNDLREAATRHLPPAYRALVAATHEPFLQTIQDLSVRAGWRWAASRWWATRLSSRGRIPQPVPRRPPAMRWRSSTR
jgi:hypothetical protein